MTYTPVEDRTILHQTAVEKVVDARLADYEPVPTDQFVEKVGGTIATPGAPGSSYVEAEMDAIHTAVSAILTALRSSGLIDA